MPLPEDNYILSRDTSEAERLRVQHEDMISCQGYYLHPDISLPPPGARIADICTGSAILLRDIAPAYPNAELHGFDISDKMFPARSELPSNIQLHLADVREPFDSRWLGYFDVVHIRLIKAAMKKETWAPVLQNVAGYNESRTTEQSPYVTLLDQSRPPGAAQESLSNPTGNPRFVPPRPSHLDRFNRHIMPNARADDITCGYMKLDILMQDRKMGNLERVDCDLYVVDRLDDGGHLRRYWAAMGIDAVWGMLKAREAAGDKLSDITREELAGSFAKDISVGGHFITRVSVFLGKKKG